MNRTSLSLKCLATVVALGVLFPGLRPSAFAQSRVEPAANAPGAPQDAPIVELTPKQLQFIQTAPAGVHGFRLVKTTVGSVDYNQNTQLQVFTPYQGRILAMLVRLNQRVKLGQPLYTVDSSDLMQAEATLVQAAGVSELTAKSLARARKLVPAGGGSQKDLDQAMSDQQTAEGNLAAARGALRIFGKDPADIDRMVNERRIDGTLVVKSPLDGVVVLSSGVPGLFIQPGTAPAPLTVADVSTKWIIANFVEADSSALHQGDDISVDILALPGRTFHARLTAVYETIDPATRRIAARAEIPDPDNVLRPGMFASVTVSTGAAFDAVALPLSGVVRKGDGTMTAWTTQDGRRFTQRVVKLGLQQDGLDQVLEGVRAGETVVTNGAAFLNNILEAGPSD